MTQVDQDVLLRQLKSDYREILIDYFTTDKTLKKKIDKFINVVFCANIPVPQIIEIHMDLIEEFSKQLKLEGRSDETLLDYRLTLIDVLAHLCEVYRCSISKQS
ncbi:circadian clock protein KaiA [Halotia branconii]|uniref:Circadian clock oscillator protein KaiA n=1 Tax=Halotia branconii CENA392 TaxID=1539056 RepID=A0AAJ6NUW2_9CYAN|nr:circadian clock protein KaiA [Halotia branconii]WGV27067.1 circadian clock protein KaiA [Halotia branconii CENA392]